MDKVQDNTEATELQAQASSNFMDDLESGKLTPDKLTDAQLDEYLEKTAYSPEKEVEQEVEDKSEIVETTIPKKVVEEAPKKELKKAIWEMQVEENRAKQLQENARKKREELEKRLLGNKQNIEQKSYAKPENYDPYAEENLAELPILKQKYSALEEKLNAWEKQQQEKEQLQIQQELYALEVDQIKHLQDEFPELKTSKPFAQVEEEYANWYHALGVDRVNRYMSDSEFRASMDEKGFKLPEDFDNYVALHGIRETYKNNRYPTMRAAFRDSYLYDQLIQNKMKSKESTVVDKAQEKAVEKLAQIQKQTPILDTTQSSTPIEKFGMNEKEMEKELIKLGTKKTLTPTEKARLESIYEALGISF